MPNAFTQSTNNNFAAQGLTLQTAGPLNVDLNTLSGGTILRTILDFDADLDIVYSYGATSVGSGVLHMGVFTENASTTPQAAFYDPNVPYGDFMHRDVWSWWTRREVGTEGSASLLVGGSSQIYDGSVRHLHMDIKQKRRIREGDGMYIATRFFKAASNVFNSVTVGYTGRVLIRIP